MVVSAKVAAALRSVILGALLACQTAPAAPQAAVTPEAPRATATRPSETPAELSPTVAASATSTPAPTSTPTQTPPPPTPAAQPTATARPAFPTATPPQTGNIERGRVLYTQKGCIECHGANAEGDVGPRLASTKLTFEEVRQQIRNPRDEMPPFSVAELSDQDIRDLYTFERSLP